MSFETPISSNFHQGSNIKTLFAIFTISSGECETYKIGIGFSSNNFLRIHSNTDFNLKSNAEKGSSNNNISGSITKALASETLCNIHHDN
ncbi:MAG: hypothetical protein U9N34_02940 [Candidatus Cloacimonadota bacterium]|nr:hypothetical protein [Candidatus Cloacimonadota bacterium]